MYLKYFYDTSLAQASYMIGCQATGEAAVIDPSRNIGDYLQIAREQGFRITGAFETHIHADFVSGLTDLARRTGATIYYSTEGAENGGYEWNQDLPLHGVKDGETINVGNIKLRALHTPGHTPEHVSYELTDGAAADRPMGVFTGDFVFVGDVGRPDLLEKSVGVKDSADTGARQMFHSLQQFKEYGDYMQIWPGHGAGSSCGKALGAVPTSTVGYERMYNPAFQPTDEQTFVDFLLDGQSEPPAYFVNMKEINKQGMTLPTTDSANEAIIISNKDGIIISWNEAAEHMFGHQAQDMIGQSLITIVPRSYRSAHLQGMLKHSQEAGEGKAMNSVVKLEGLHRDGYTFPIELALSQQNHGHQKYYTGVIRDLSAQTKT